MAITNGYTSLDILKSRLGIAVTDTDDDTTLEAVITAVSRWIDRYCGRRFYTTTSDEARYYTAVQSDCLLTDDIVSVTSIATDEDGDQVYETNWAATDYELEPPNAALDGEPYTTIRVSPNGNYSFPTGVLRGVKVVGKFGYAASAPAPVQEACIIQCSRIYRRKDAPFGVTGDPEFGQTAVIMRLDWDVKYLLETYRRLEVG